MTCAHCRAADAGAWLCAGCKDMPLCRGCAIEVGLFGVGPAKALTEPKKVWRKRGEQHER